MIEEVGLAKVIEELGFTAVIQELTAHKSELTEEQKAELKELFD